VKEYGEGYYSSINKGGGLNINAALTKTIYLFEKLFSNEQKKHIQAFLDEVKIERTQMSLLI